MTRLLVALHPLALLPLAAPALADAGMSAPPAAAVSVEAAAASSPLISAATWLLYGIGAYFAAAAVVGVVGLVLFALLWRRLGREFTSVTERTKRDRVRP